MALFTALLASLRRDEEGQGLAEYALILALIAIVAIIALLFLGGQISSILNTVGSERLARSSSDNRTAGPLGPGGFFVSCLQAPNTSFACLTLVLAAHTLPQPPASRGACGEGGVQSVMSMLTALIASFRSDEEGQGLAEYALILALIAIVAIIALLFLGGQISGILNTVGSSV